MDEDDRESEDGAARAFGQLTREVSLLRAAVEGLTAARESIDIPDYHPTLERTEKVLGVLAQQIAGMRKSPALAMGPAHMAGEIASAATAARREDQRLVTEVRTALDQAAREIGSRLASARRGDEQNRWLLWIGLGGVVLGLLLYALMAGPLARLAPTSWQWPERVATQVLGEPTAFDAGQHLMRAANADGWRAIVVAANLVKDNRDTIDRCQEQATKAKKAVRCTIEVKSL